MRHLGDEELAALDRQCFHEEMAIVVHQFEPKIAPPYLEEVVVEERFCGHLVVELPVVEVAAFIPQPKERKAGVGRAKATRERWVCAVWGALAERARWARSRQRPERGRNVEQYMSILV